MTAPKVHDGSPADYEVGQLVTWHTAAGPAEMVYVEQLGPWIELVSLTGLTGVVVHEREVSPR
jgi:hypothetical protein